MPIKKASIKSVRQDKKRRIRNLRVTSELKTKLTKFEALLREKNKEQAKVVLDQLISKIDKAKSKGIIRKNTASRKKSRLTKRLTKLGT